MEITRESGSIQEAAAARQVVISVEFVAYLLLALLALALRFAELDIVPMTDAESREALAAWRALYPEAAGGVIVPQSPLLFFLHSLSFSLMGATELSARLFTALAGAAVVLLPLLFRDLIGQARALILSVLLACSPVLLAASRFDRPVIWSLLLGVAAVWAYWRYTALRQPIYAVLATALLVATVLLTEPAGFVMALVLIERVRRGTGTNQAEDLD